MDNIWWVWMVIAAVFIVGEIFTAGFFLLWFGIGAGLAGLLAYVGVGLAWQIVTFIVVSVILFVFSRQFAERFSKQQPPGIGADRFVGQEGVVLEAIDPARNMGRVRVGQDEWRARSETGQTIAAEAWVKVVRVDGTHLVVTVSTREGE